MKVILNRGTVHSPSFLTILSKLYNNTFLSINQRPLGDVPYSMNIGGSRAYIVVNNSGKIEVVDRNHLKSVATISELNSPRYISLVSDRKAYVTSLYSDSITVVDLLSNTVSALYQPETSFGIDSLFRYGGFCCSLGRRQKDFCDQY